MDTKKQKLIEALKLERVQFSNRGQSTMDHDVTIEYLETGTTTEDPDEFELLGVVMYDYDIFCSDYGVTD